jgi:hypothetical protein
MRPTTSVTCGPQVQCVVVDIVLPPLDHACGPDCVCWERAVTPRAASEDHREGQ